MRLAPLLNWEYAFDYARMHGFEIVKLEAVTPMNNLTRKLTQLLIDAIEKNCVEFCFGEITPRYDFKTDLNNWNVCLLAFRESTKK